MSVFDAQGRRVMSRDAGRMSMGTHTLTWDGRDASGSEVGAGMLWVRIELDGRATTHKVIRIR
jgi:flagellar hook assembly protein FlgD